MKNWLGIGVRLGLAILTHAGAIETIATAIGNLRGPQKEDAVVSIVRGTLEVAEGVAGRDLLDDIEVQTATRDLVKAYVALQNVVALKRVA